MTPIFLKYPFPGGFQPLVTAGCRELFLFRGKRYDMNQ